jgi:hypothetical protein
VLAFVNGGRIGGEQVLPAAVIAKLNQGNVPIPGSNASYSYGLQVSTFRGINTVAHGGSRSGYGSVIRMAPQQRFGVIVLANRTGVSLNRTATKAMEMLLPLDSTTAETGRAPMTMTAAEMKAIAGTYSQSTRTMTITLRDGRLFLMQGKRESPLEKVGANEFQSGDGRFVAVPGGDGRIEYLHAGGRSWRKLS